MFHFNELNQIHLEITSNCQASCPMCTRNIHGGVTNELLPLDSWTLDQYKTIISPEVLNQVKMIYFCGNYGDPLLNNNLIEMIRYSASVNPALSIRVHTNGSLRNAAWWKELYKALPKDHAVVFAIDGLEDTHSIYRVGTDFTKIIENATSFINAGGNAEWAYIRFKHNEHQVDQARLLATELNFKVFTMKDSSRFLMKPEFEVLNKNGEVIYNLEPSTYSEIKFIDKKVIDSYKMIMRESTIDCYALKLKEIYITAQGNVFPCCWLALLPYHPVDRASELQHIRYEITNQYYELVESLGGIERLDATKQSIRDIMESTEYQTVWDSYWNDNKLITCARSCGVLPDIYSTPKDQIVSIERLG